VNFIDCALLYGFGKSEKVLGEAMKGRRGDFVISTKGGLVWDMEEGASTIRWTGQDL
jgi:methylglyoxal reductase